MPKAVITDYRVEKISVTKSRTQPKIILTVKTENDKKYEISEIFFIKNNKEVCQGLWVNLTNSGEITNKSTLNALLTFFKKETLDELKGLKVKLKPNKEGYFAINCTNK